MKPEQDGWFGAGGAISQSRECCDETPPLPEIVGEVTNPVLETMRCLWWREFDRICSCVMLIRLFIQDRIYGPEPPIAADLIGDPDHE
jgi:hypothetical protein